MTTTKLSPAQRSALEYARKHKCISISSIVAGPRGKRYVLASTLNALLSRGMLTSHGGVFDRYHTITHAGRAALGGGDA